MGSSEISRDLCEPRLSKRGVQLEKLQKAVPELFTESAVAPLRTLVWKSHKVQHYQDTKTLLALTSVEILPDIGSVPFGALLEIPATIMWEHQGVCP